MQPITMAPALDSTDTSGEVTLINLLKALQARQAQPVVPDNPLAQLGTMLSGFAAGTQGKPNPVLGQFQSMREQDLQGLAGQGQMAQAIATLQERKVSRQESREDKLDTIISTGLKATDPQTRMFFAGTFQTRMKARGMDIPDSVVAGMGMGQFTKEGVENVVLLQSMGRDPATISRITGLPLDVVAATPAVLQNDDMRKMLGLPTKAELDANVLDEELKLTTIAEKNAGLAIPGVGKDVVPHALRLFPDKDPRTLTTREWSLAADSFLRQDLEKAKLAAGLPPVPKEMIQYLGNLETQGQGLAGVSAIVNDPKKWAIVEPFIGPMLTGGALREMAARGLPESLVGKVPNELTDLAFGEAQYSVFLANALSGAAIPIGEYERLVKLAPDRGRDKPEVYRRKVAHAQAAQRVILQRARELASVGGRGDVGNSVDAIRNNPLPALELPQEATSIFYNPKTGKYATGKLGMKTPEGWVVVK